MPPLPSLEIDEQAIRRQRAQRSAFGCLFLSLVILLFDLCAWVALQYPFRTRSAQEQANVDRILMVLLAVFILTIAAIAVCTFILLRKPRTA